MGFSGFVCRLASECSRKSGSGGKGPPQDRLPWLPIKNVYWKWADDIKLGGAVEYPDGREA